MLGYELVAQSLRDQHIDYVFGVVGFPVIELATAIQMSGINYIGMRNEQSVRQNATLSNRIHLLTGRLRCTGAWLFIGKASCVFDGFDSRSVSLICECFLQ